MYNQFRSTNDQYKLQSHKVAGACDMKEEDTRTQDQLREDFKKERDGSCAVDGRHIKDGYLIIERQSVKMIVNLQI